MYDWFKYDSISFKSFALKASCRVNPCRAPTATAATTVAVAAATSSVQLPQREHVARTGGLRHIDRPESAGPVDAFTSALVSSLKALVRFAFTA